MKLVFADQDIAPGPSIFLAGPTPRSSRIRSWRLDAVEILRELGYGGQVLVPESPGFTFAPFCNMDGYSQQVEWEHIALIAAGTIAFWVPRNMSDMPGLTTNDEFGYWRHRAPGKILFGAPPSASHIRYQVYKAKQVGIPVFDDLGLLMGAAAEREKEYRP